MKRIARYLYNTLRTAAVTILVVPVLAFALAYVLLVLPSVQNKIKHEGEKALSELLHTQVTIHKISIKPFNQLVLEGVNVPDQQGDSLIVVDKLGAGVSIYNLMLGKLVFTYGEIIGLHGRITRPDKESPPNVQFLIDALKPKPNQPPKPFDLKIYNVVIRKSDLTYDVFDQAPKASRFDANHVRVKNLRADVALPRLKNNDFIIELKRLSFDEGGGFELKHLSAQVAINDTCLSAKDIEIELPHTQLSPADVELHYSSLKNLGKELPDHPLDLQLVDNTITPSDFACFEPKLQSFDEPMKVTAKVNGTSRYLNVPQLKVKNRSGSIDVDLSGSVSDLADSRQMAFDFPKINVSCQGQEIEKITSHLASLSPQTRGIVERMGNVVVDGALKGGLQNLSFNGKLATSIGSVDLDGKMSESGGNRHIAGNVTTTMLQLGRLLGKEGLLGEVALDADVDLALEKGNTSGHIDGHIDHVDFRGYRYHDIDADITKAGNNLRGQVAMNDGNGRIVADGDITLAGANTTVDFNAQAEGVNLNRMGLIKKYAGYDLSANIDAHFSGNNLDNANGNVTVSDLRFANEQNRGLHLEEFVLDADNASPEQRLAVNSDWLNGEITGSFNFKTLVPATKRLLGQAFPTFFGSDAAPAPGKQKSNDLAFNFVLVPNDELKDLVKLPVNPLDEITIDGHISETAGTFDLHVDAPYLLQGSKRIIEGTRLDVSQDSVGHNVLLRANTIFPAKNGKIAVTIGANGVNDRLDTDLAWRMMRERDFHGNLNLSAALKRGDDKKVGATIDVNPSEIVFNDTAWAVLPGVVDIDHGVITVQNLAGQHEGQYIRVNGVVSHDADDELCLQLNDVSLDYVFETLNIDNVDFGGKATGDFYASDLLSGAPRLSTPDLHVVGLSYNNAVMGDANIKSHWENETKSVALNAHLNQKNGHETVIDGNIYVVGDSLHLTFDADHANVAFMKPFMAAFTSNVQGEVSGKAVLFGDFHNINLYGDVCADSLFFHLDYTNVNYTCAGDSVHMVPNRIWFDRVKISDRYGHTALMGGWLNHNSFHDPVFNFGITNAKNLLCYDTDASVNDVWYGTVFGNGSAFVTGEPGVVNIKVNMETAPGSKFTFVMSDTKQASEYNFITFRDRDKKDNPDVEEDDEESDSIPLLVRQLTERVQQKSQDRPTAYTIDLQGDITPAMQLIIVMDPVGGDQIKATGLGNMRLTYNNNDEMAMYGKYTLEKGSYNFTLQDIIIKDFTIRNGSSISFQGDPYAAELDIEAVYSLNANLRDLDESFAVDKDLNRTSVPVHALLRAKGVINHPDISFDLEFPTLTTDAYRKVKSIISTDDMMNQQIIYLLALNRFYTPDYLLSTSSTNNNQLSSVASSTISSHLSNILGKMSENWTIAPNFRSDKGDFSDMEVDVALSSQLLNNRLLLNGNFGYRDNTYNTRNSNFIGDFDIEYLLNARGTLRLKAYNHFNDQNYYVRNALTTQGVGIVLKHDFDSPFNILRKHRKAQATDSVTALPNDGNNKEKEKIYNKKENKQ